MELLCRTEYFFDIRDFSHRHTIFLSDHPLDARLRIDLCVKVASTRDD